MSSPKVFISYSWSNHDHEQLVLQIATELVESGIDVILDKWDLKEGHDAYTFMEKMVTDSDIKKVAIISDKVYAEKADDRSGGVGTETQIISREVYEQAQQDKFVVVVTERNEQDQPCLPTYYKSRIYIDLSQPDRYSENFEKLLRWLFDKPLYVKPAPGAPPNFLEESESVSIGTSSAFKRLIDAIRTDKATTTGFLDEYLSMYSTNLERFRVRNTDGELDETTYESILAFLPARNEYVQLVATISQFQPKIESVRRLHRFIETIISYMHRPEHITTYNEREFDNYKFIVHELFLYTLAIFIKNEQFELAAHLLSQQYYVGERQQYGDKSMVEFHVIRQYTETLEHRNRRLGLRKLSLRAHLLKERSQATGVEFRYLMQADFVAFIRVELLKTSEYDHWWPETLLYLDNFGGSFEMFARSISQNYFDRVKTLLGIETKTALDGLLTEYAQDRSLLPRWGFKSFSPRALLGYEDLCTVP